MMLIDLKKIFSLNCLSNVPTIIFLSQKHIFGVLTLGKYYILVYEHPILTPDIKF